MNGMTGDDAYVLAKKYTDKTVAGVGGLKGEDGFSPTIVENSHNSEDIYKLDITDVNGTKTTPNLKADISEVKNELQEEINKKANVIHTHVSADITDVDTAPTNGSEELVTSGGVYTALSGKQATITGGASTITSSNLTANRALVSDASGKVAVSDVTSTELGYLDGVTSNVQTQLNGKQEALVCSGDEYDTGKIWLDGSTIYRKDISYKIPTDSNMIDWDTKTINLSNVIEEFGRIFSNNTVNFEINIFGGYSKNGGFIQIDNPISAIFDVNEIKFDLLNHVIADDYNFLLIMGYVEYVKHDIDSNIFKLLE